jgi:hypothetical protein
MKKYGFGRNPNLTLASYFLCMFAYWGLYSFVGNLYLLRLGYDVMFVGQVNSVGFLVYCVLSFPAGFLAVRWGLRRSMIAGALLFVIFFAAFATIELLPTRFRMAMIIAYMVPGGAGGALYMACVNPCLMETGSSRRAAALSAGAMVNLVAYAVGNLAGGVLTGLSSRLSGVPESSPAPYRLGLVVAVVAQLGSVACIIPMRSPSASRPNPAGSGNSEDPAPARMPLSLFVVTVVAGVLMTVFGSSVQTFFSLHLDQTFKVPTQSIGAVLGVARGIPAIAFALSPLLIRRYGAYRTAVLAAVVSTLVATSIGLAARWLTAAAGYALMNFLFSLGSPANSLLYQEAVAPSARPVVTGVTNAAYGLGSAAILFVGGYAISWLGYGRFFLAGLAAQVAGIAVFALYFGLRERLSLHSHK